MSEIFFNKVDKNALKLHRVKNFKLKLKTFLNHKFIVIGGLIILALIVVASFSNFIITHDPFKINLDDKFLPLSRNHFFGTDNFGRDIFSRVVLGAKLSLLVGAISTGISTVIGSLLGLIAGYYGKWVDNLIMRCMDGIFSVPTLILAIVFVSLMGPSIVNIFLAVSIVFIPVYARLVRGRVLVIKKDTFIDAEFAIGQSNIKIIFSHIFPNLLNVILVEATAVFSEAIIIEATLSFLGIGVPPPNPSWGTMLLEAKNYLLYYPLFAIFPGIAICITVLGFNLFGDGLRDVLDPRLSRSSR